MSRIAAVTRVPSALSSGLSMISIGNSLPSLRRPVSSIPPPVRHLLPDEHIAVAAELLLGLQVQQHDPAADLLCQRAFLESKIVRHQPFREALRDDVRHLLPEQLVAAVAELLLGLQIQQD